MTHANGPGEPDLKDDHEEQDGAGQTDNGAPGPEQAAAAAAALAEENADLKDRVLRMAAEMDNLRKRTEREKRDSSQYAIAGFAGDMLVVADNLARALASAEAADQPAESGGETEASAATLASLKEGVRMTEHELLRLLDKHGVKKIQPDGERFDPHQHQAMFEVPDESVPAGTVVQVAQTGFMIGDRVLRPALVGVSKGGPKVRPAAQQAEIDKSADQAANDDGPSEEPHIDKTV
jgi:molecular chaperone GrpE